MVNFEGFSSQSTSKCISISRRVTRGGEGGIFPCPFLKFKEKCPNFGKNALTRFIYGLNFSFKMLF